MRKRNVRELTWEEFRKEANLKGYWMDFETVTGTTRRRGVIKEMSWHGSILGVLVAFTKVLQGRDWVDIASPDQRKPKVYFFDPKDSRSGVRARTNGCYEWVSTRMYTCVVAPEIKDLWRRPSARMREKANASLIKNFRKQVREFAKSKRG